MARITGKKIKSEYYGRMNDPSGSAYIKGLCGDEVEFYLVIENNIITGVKYYTDGCVFTRACAEKAAELVFDKTIADALRVSPRQVSEALEGSAQEYIHCSILAVSTLHKAISDYLLKP